MFDKLREKVAAKVAHNKRMAELYNEVMSGTSVITVRNRKDLHRVILPNPTVEYILVYIIEQDLFVRLNNDYRDRGSNPQPATVDSSAGNSDEQ